MSFEKEQYNQIEKTSHLEMIKQLFGNTQIDSLFGFLQADIKVPNKLEELLVLSIIYYDKNGISQFFEDQITI